MEVLLGKVVKQVCENLFTDLIASANLTEFAIQIQNLMRRIVRLEETLELEITAVIKYH